MTPERPPIVNRNTKVIAKRFAVSEAGCLPPHIVAIQLKILTAVGTAMSIVVVEKAASATGPRPVVNMWCDHTPKPTKPIMMPEKMTKGAPKSGFFAKVGRTSDTRPIGRQDEDVDLGVAEEPEEVLPQQRVATVGRKWKKFVPKVRSNTSRMRPMVNHREAHDDEELHHQAHPREDRHPEQGHARRAQVQDGGDEVEARHDRVLLPRMSRPRSQKSIDMPAEYLALVMFAYPNQPPSGNAFNEERHVDEDAAEQVQPVGQRGSSAGTRRHGRRSAAGSGS